MNQSRPQESIVRALLRVSEEALQAARIEHHTAYEAAMDERGRLLCALWGFPEDKELPEFSQKMANELRGKLPRISDKDRTRLRELDRGILLALGAQKKRVIEDEAQVTRGRRFMEGIRALGTGKTGVRVDRSG
ncbi:hypothetical protein KQI63_02350 [bacterium]|nr:hypothetical protein [bacterium]